MRSGQAEGPQNGRDVGEAHHDSDRGRHARPHDRRHYREHDDIDDPREEGAPSAQDATANASERLGAAATHGHPALAHDKHGISPPEAADQSHDRLADS
jgi:hypothetical protein